MSRFGIVILVLLVLLHLALPAFAQAQDTQDTQEAAETPLTEAALLDLLRRAEEALERAEAAANETDALLEQSEKMLDLAIDMFALFEAMAGAVGLGVPVLAVLAALVGFRRLESAKSELQEARERFEKDVHEKEVQFDALQEALERSVNEQRGLAGKASLALALLPLAERQYRAQDYSGALDTYRRALALDPENPIIHYRLGYVYTQSGELPAAEAALTRSLQIDPEFAPSRAALGYVYRRQGDDLPPSIERDLVYNKAENNFLQALHTSPKLVDEDNESWWGALGGLYRRRGQVEQAIRAYENGTQVTPHSSYPYSNLALLYFQNGDREKALKAYERVERLALNEVRADVDNYWAYADLVVSRMALGKYDDAENVLETTLNIAPAESPYTLDSLVSTLQRLSEAMNTPEQEAVERVVQKINDFRTQRSDTQPTMGL